MIIHSLSEIQYFAGMDAANGALDSSPLNASDMLRHWRAVEAEHRAAEQHHLAEYAKGAGDIIQEFLDDKAS